MNVHPEMLLDLSRQRQAELIAEAADYHRAVEARHGAHGQREPHHRKHHHLAWPIALWRRADPSRSAASADPSRSAARLAECAPAAAE